VVNCTDLELTVVKPNISDYVLGGFECIFSFSAASLTTVSSTQAFRMYKEHLSVAANV